MCASMKTDLFAIADVSLTDEAAAQIRRLLTKNGDPAPEGKGLRLSVESGGCSGYRYVLELAEAKPGDLTTYSHDLPVHVPSASAAFLKGVVVDYSDDLNDSGFKIRNPNARRSCGCGQSFGT
ncbi:MAG: iron-sulfur cluster assembly accessory protein [Verrucomicrobia bacterium]|nr:MAG: iron-sulfur cluster assembly accessory protein [Verrucomicrobiota bacterium]